MNKKKLIIIVPAREGSQGIKNKNLTLIKKKPLVTYSFELAKKINEKNKIIFCSTDSKKIKDLATKAKINASFLRPKKISKNLSRDLDFVNHTLTNFYNKGFSFKYGLILRPTSPIRNINYVNNAYEIFKRNKKLDSMRAIIEAPLTPFKMWYEKNNIITSIIKSKIEEHYNAPRQILPTIYWQTGNFEFFKIDFKKHIKSISGKKIYGYKIKKKYSIDIDNLQDINQAEKYI